MLLQKKLSLGTIPEDILVWRSFRAPHLDMLSTLDSFRNSDFDIVQNSVRMRLKMTILFYLGFTSYLMIPIEVGLILSKYFFSEFLIQPILSVPLNLLCGLFLLLTPHPITIS